ncbi:MULTISPECIES: Glu/Leu/Phe/Val dehydrogenase dimerization domain-containing protein [unclassified Streptosporangium]|uniref:Glu/Leu/Phe/Val dehydrogenase dimerization domain-containing protein n=1 Tax=unclassified Streptosporangium TaxID=2632669 RepID=UPI002E2CD745|nr:MULTISPECIES: Glu/Leu/Phe/Val dehydrogenase dimerization domain-containing protein [unclassified Streptosporangium]
MSGFDHEQVAVHTGPRSGLPVIVAVHSTALGQAVGGCRIWHYPDWRDGLTDALRLSAGMTAKCAVAGLANGGGKTVVAVPEGVDLDPVRRRHALYDVADVIASLDGRYATGPDVGTTPADMAIIGERTPHVFCRPARQAGSGDSSPHTATGTLAALRAVSRRIHGTPSLTGRRVAVVGLGNVGEKLVRLLAAEGAELLVGDIDPGKRALADEVGATWGDPARVVTADVDILVPAALGGVLTEEIVPDLRCAAIAGPANNQLSVQAVAGLLHRRGIIWVPDYVAGAGGVIHALTVELNDGTADEALTRVQNIEDTVDTLLATAERNGTTPAQAASELTRLRLRAAAASHRSRPRRGETAARHG